MTDAKSRSETSQPSPQRGWTETVRAFFSNWGELLYVLTIIVAMFAVRVVPYARFLSEDGRVVFSGNDAWYHLRTTEYSVYNWPSRMGFDPWTGYPVGSTTGQFGTLYDQILATVALILGLGDPSQTTISLVTLFAPSVFGALLVVPTYYLVRELEGAVTASLSIGLLALLPGVFLHRGLVGMSDHNIAEPFFLMIFIALAIFAIRTSRDEQVTVERIRSRDFSGIRKPAVLAASMGVGAAMYISVWPPGIFITGLLGLFFTTSAFFAYRRKETPEPTLLVGVLSMVVLTVLLVMRVDYYGASFTRLSIVHVAAPLLVVAGCVLLLGIYWFATDRELSVSGYIGLSVGAGLVSVGVISVVFPAVFDAVFANGVTFLSRRVSPQSQTIREAQMMWGQGYAPLLSQYGFLPLAAPVGAVLWMYHAHQENSHEHLFVIMMGCLFTAAAFLQLRFNYYLAGFIAIFAGVAISAVLQQAQIGLNTPHFQSKKVVALLVVMILVIPVLVYPVSSSAYGVAQTHGVGEYNGWDSTLDWMNTETPSPESTEMEYYGSYDESTFSYPDSAYGVLSWWDYGHWLTVTSERIPIANPFQQHAPHAAKTLLSTNESDIDTLGTARFGDAPPPRYVVVDWKMVTPYSKMGALTVFDDSVNQSDLARQTYYPSGQEYRPGPHILSDRYYQSFAVRLYHLHGSAAVPQPVVVETSEQQLLTRSGQAVAVETLPRNKPFVREFESMSEARQYVSETPTAQVGGIGTLTPEYVPALQQYRLVKVSPETALENPQYQNNIQRDLSLTQLTPQTLTKTPAWVKVFERVPGAKIHGHGPANATVSASVPLIVPDYNQTFVYQQYAETDESGHFSMVLPYSTEGYSEFTPEEGYTNTSIRADEPYSFTSITTDEVDGNETVSQYRATADVSEAHVVGVETATITVDLKFDGSSSDVTEDSVDDGSETPDQTVPAEQVILSEKQAGENRLMLG